jgi:hypothetical protein
LTELVDEGPHIERDRLAAAMLDHVHQRLLRLPVGVLPELLDPGTLQRLVRQVSRQLADPARRRTCRRSPLVPGLGSAALHSGPVLRLQDQYSVAAGRRLAAAASRLANTAASSRRRAIAMPK